ncbi:hypothetical protein [Streptacidiphilus sp. EB103A]|uniref:hypothetical protein n=1 Tax=Streptacidiphilus sp. EB103A TaxID=3156275 RepID=UPI003518DD32
MTASPEDKPLSASEKVSLSEFAGTLVITASEQKGVPFPRAAVSGTPQPLSARERRQYFERLIQRAVDAGLGTNPHAHSFLAHELDYFSGRPRILGFEDDPSADE